MRILNAIEKFFSLEIPNLGFMNAVDYELKKRLINRVGYPKLYKLSSRRLPEPILCRNGSTDILVFHQIFVWLEYQCLFDIEDPLLIIDCGANVGYSSLFFLEHFKRAELIAIEPDARNFKILSANLKRYGDRSRVIHGAVWLRSCGLKVVSEGLGKEWETKVRECEKGESENVRGYSISEIIEMSKQKRAAILKIDIEGGEKYLFSGDPSWLPFVDHMVIELHGNECEEAVNKAMQEYTFEYGTCFELKVFKNIKRI